MAVPFVGMSVRYSRKKSERDSIEKGSPVLVGWLQTGAVEYWTTTHRCASGSMLGLFLHRVGHRLANKIHRLAF